MLHRLDEANVGVKLEKCNSAEAVEWVRYKLSQSGVEPINSNVQGISERLRQKHSKQLKSFLGVVNQFNKFIHELANCISPLEQYYR